MAGSSHRAQHGPLGVCCTARRDRLVIRHSAVRRHDTLEKGDVPVLEPLGRSGTAGNAELVDIVCLLLPARQLV